MKKTKITTLGLMAGLFTAAPGVAVARATIPVQAHVTERGAPLDRDVRLEVRLYATPRDGEPLFAETQRLRARDGYLGFSVGAVEALDLVEHTREGALWLAVSIDGQPEMVPRIRLGTMPFAARADLAQDAAHLGGRAPDDFAAARHLHSVRDLSDLPEGWLDGDDVLSEETVGRYARRVCYDTPEELTAELDGRYLSGGVATHRALFADGLLDGRDADDLVTFAAAARRFVRPNATTVGDLEITGEFRWSSPRVRSRFVPAASFSVDAAAGSAARAARVASRLVLDPATAPGTVSLFAPISLPAGAIVDEVSCSAHDGDPGASLDLDVALEARPLAAPEGVKLLGVTLATNDDPGVVQRAQVATRATVRADHAYYLTGTVRWTGAHPDVAFLGCAVRLRQVGPE